MKTTLSALLLLCVAASAGVPQKKPVTAYGHLSSQSPFTTKPVVESTQHVDTTFDDWALGGVSEIEGGYMVTLFHKKNAGETQVIKPRGTIHSAKDQMKWLNPGEPGSFKVERVDYGKKSWKETTVTLAAGARKGQVKFDDKQLLPSASAPAQQPRQQQGAGGQPPQQNAAQQQQQQQQTNGQQQPPREGRRLRVLPPTPNGGQPQQNQGRSNR